MTRERTLGVFDVTAQGVVNAHGLADGVGGGADGVDLAAEDQFFDPLLDQVIQLVTIGAEKLDAVVGVRIVRGGDDDAGIRPQTAGDVSHPRRGQRADEQHVHAHGKDARGNGVLQHVAGEAGVLADDDFVFAAAAGLRFQVLENVGGGPAQPERGLGGDGFDVGGAADTVGSKDLGGLAHGGWEFKGRRVRR